jgi:hypothetical protein
MMDPSVTAAMAKWPNVPDCRGWLSLDRRGQWRLQGSPVRHAGLAEFIGRNYECDDSGAWFMQNGPQRVWLELTATPWIFRLIDGQFVTHTGVPAGEVEAAWLVDGEALCLRTGSGFGLIDDRDLLALFENIRRPDGTSPDGNLAAEPALLFHWGANALPLSHCADDELETIGGFRRSP